MSELSSGGWLVPSRRVRALLREGAEIALRLPAEMLGELDDVVLSRSAPGVAEDPALSAAVRRSMRSSLLVWAAANVRSPGARVEPVVDDDAVEGARDVARRGVETEYLDSYRVAQGVAIRLWTQIAFTLTQDPDELRDLLEAATRSIATYVDDLAVATAELVRRERGSLTSGNQAERRRLVTLLVEGDATDVAELEARLGHGLAGTHVAAVAWSETPSAGQSALDDAARLITTEHARDALVVIADSGTRWVWTRRLPDADQLRRAVSALPGIRVALGGPGRGLDGFRSSHIEATTTQQVLSGMPPTRQVAFHDEIALVALLLKDPERADAYVRRVLGDLRTAPEELRETVRVYLGQLGNASRTADLLFTHRNTVLRRIARADQLLPRPLAGRPLDVAAALELLRWAG